MFSSEKDNNDYDNGLANVMNIQGWFVDILIVCAARNSNCAQVSIVSLNS